MAISYTVKNVSPLTNSLTLRAQAGEALEPGMAVYVSSASGDIPVIKKADATDEDASKAIGIVAAVNGQDHTSAASGDAVTVVTFGRVGGFSGMTAGGFVYVDETAGKLTQIPPATSGSYKFIVGRAVSATVIHVAPFAFTLDANS